MESEVQEAPQVPRSELDAAFNVSRAWGGMVVQGVPTAPWGYELWSPNGADRDRWATSFQVAMELSEDRQRHSHTGTTSDDGDWDY